MEGINIRLNTRTLLVKPDVYFYARHFHSIRLNIVNQSQSHRHMNQNIGPIYTAFCLEKAEYFLGKLRVLG